MTTLVVPAEESALLAEWHLLPTFCGEESSESTSWIRDYAFTHFMPPAKYNAAAIKPAAGPLPRLGTLANIMCSATDNENLQGIVIAESSLRRRLEG